MLLESIFSLPLLWFLAALGLAFLELAAPGFILIFFSLGALATSGVLLLLDLSISQQIMLFLLSSLVSLLVLRRWVSSIFRGSAKVQAGDMDDFPCHCVVPVIKTIYPGQPGRVRHRGTEWYAAAEEEIPAGTMVELLSYADDSKQVFRVGRK